MPCVKRTVRSSGFLLVRLVGWLAVLTVSNSWSLAFTPLGCFLRELNRFPVSRCERPVLEKRTGGVFSIDHFLKPSFFVRIDLPTHWWDGRQSSDPGCHVKHTKEKNIHLQTPAVYCESSKLSHLTSVEVLLPLQIFSIVAPAIYAQTILGVSVGRNTVHKLPSANVAR